MKKIIYIITILMMSVILFSCDDIINNPTIDDPITEEVDTGTFNRLFDGVSYRKITITITSENWLDLNESLLNHLYTFGNLKTDLYVLADMTYEDELGKIEINNVGFRTRGNLSVNYLINDEGNINLNSFKINFRETFDDTILDNQGRRGFELKELDLKWNRNYDSTYLTEQYALDMMNHFGVYAAQTSHVLFSLNIDGVETLMGLYTAFEPIDDEFIERRLTKLESDGDLYKCLWQQYGPATLSPIVNMMAIGQRDVASNYMPAYDLKTNKDTSDHSAFLNFIQGINQANPIPYFENYFEIEMFLKLLAVNAFIGNPDDYRAMGNNYFMYQNSQSKKWFMIPYDFDHGFGQGWWQADVYPDYSIGVDVYEWFNLNQAFNVENYAHPLVDVLLSNQTYKDLYTQYLQEILDDSYFTALTFDQRFNEVKNVFESTFDDALQNQGFGLRNAIEYINAKRVDINRQING